MIPDQELTAAYGATIREQSALSEQLQSARAVLLDRPGEKGERIRLAASIGILLDALDALVAAQCDVELLRKTPAAATALARIGDALRVGSLDLEHLSLELLTTGHPILPPDHQLAIEALKREAARAEGEAMDPKARAALDATTWRLVLSLSHIRRLEQALSNDATARAAIGDVNLAAFIPKRRYAPSVLAPQFSLESPVLRFAVRLALAMMAGAVVAQSLGDERHGNWVLLTIAVVMRAGYGLTKQRRDDRVIGTLVGCVVAAGSVAYLPGRGAGRRPGPRGRRDPQLCAAQLPPLFVRRFGDRAGVAASGPAVGLGADPGAACRHADRRGDRASLQLSVAALGIFGGATAREPSPGPAFSLRRRGAQNRRQRSRLPARAQECDRGDRRAVRLGRANEHRADGRAQGSR